MKFFTIITTVVAAAVVTRIGSASTSVQELGASRQLSHSAHHSRHKHHSKNNGKKHGKHGHGGGNGKNNDDSDDGLIEYRSSGKRLSFTTSKKKKSSSHGLRRSSSSTEKDHSYRIELLKGTRSGLCAHASGAGAYARLTGTMEFRLIQMTRSQKYHELKNKYSIGGGVSAFYEFIGLHMNAEKTREEITRTLEEVMSTSETTGRTTFDLLVTGQKQSVALDACAYVTIMRFTDSQGNTYDMVSEEASQDNTGAMDSQTKEAVPTKENESTIIFL